MSTGPVQDKLNSKTILKSNELRQATFTPLLPRATVHVLARVARFMRLGCVYKHIYTIPYYIKVNVFYNKISKKNKTMLVQYSGYTYSYTRNISYEFQITISSLIKNIDITLLALDFVIQI